MHRLSTCDEKLLSTAVQICTLRNAAVNKHPCYHTMERMTFDMSSDVFNMKCKLTLPFFSHTFSSFIHFLTLKGTILSKVPGQIHDKLTLWCTVT